MNYLAHIYLSGESDEIILGNFIGDFVKGNKYLKYPEQVAFGIQLHRSIDSFTDQHRDVREFIQLLKPGYGRYSGIVADVFMDHFLASEWNRYSAHTLRQVSKHAHAVFLSNFLLLPFKVKQFLPFLIQHKRFESYAQRESMFHVLEIMSRRTSLPANGEWAMQILHQEYDRFKALFRSFFPEMIEYVETDYGIRIARPEQVR
jgi:acyl carrier protein phosphodiesterase